MNRLITAVLTALMLLSNAAFLNINDACAANKTSQKAKTADSQKKSPSKSNKQKTAKGKAQSEKNRQKHSAAANKKTENKQTAQPQRKSGGQSRTSRKSDIEEYLKRIQRIDPYAVITGWFDDWRDVSIYRSHAGYHLGYDIGLLKGFAVPSGWSGTIVDIVPWASNEWGIYLETKEGYIISFGHLVPTVRIGAKIDPGMTVGTVSVNHVDIKVRDRQGRYIDIGKTSGLLAIDPNVMFYLDKSNYSVTKIDMSKVIKAKQSEIAKLKESYAILSDYLEAENDILASVKEDTERSRSIYESGLISKSELETRENEQKIQQAKTDDLKIRLNIQKQNIDAIRKFLKANNATEPSIAKKEKKIKDADKEKLAKAKAEAEKYRDLYDQGAVPRKTAEEKEREYKRLQLEIRLKTAE